MSVWGLAVYLAYVARAVSYIRVRDSNTQCEHITDEAECVDAAIAVGMVVTAARPDSGGLSWAPPYCYLQGSWLKFNENGENTGQCKPMTNCLCRENDSLPAPGNTRRGATPAPTIVFITPEPTSTTTPSPTLILTPSPTLNIEPSHQQQRSYWLVGIPIECERIMSKDECGVAGRHLLGDQTIVPVEVNQADPSLQAPPYCYVENGDLKFNSNGLNTGTCSANNRCVCLRGIVYGEVTEGFNCRWIRSISECNIAAETIGLLDTTAIDDRNDGANNDPKGCYWESGQLKYNSAGTNTGRCSVNDRCLCRISVNEEATEFVDTVLQGLPEVVKKAEIRSISGANEANPDHLDLVLEVELMSE